jgi:hypothetical protein
MKAEADRALAKTRRIRETAANANPLISRSNAAADLEAKLKGKDLWQTRRPVCAAFILSMRG